MQPTVDDMREPKRPRLLTDAEDDCMREIRCFVRGGATAQQMLPRIISGMWARWDVNDHQAKHNILHQAGVYDAGLDVMQLV
jgi:hypothetical protein